MEVKGFHVTNRAWYANSASGIFENPQLSIGIYYTEGGTLGEFVMEWTDLGFTNGLCPQLKIFDDGWKILFVDMPELAGLATLVDGRKSPTQDQVIAFLLSVGFQDLTAYKRPDDIQTVDGTLWDALKAASKRLDSKNEKDLALLEAIHGYCAGKVVLERPQSRRLK